MPSRSTPFVLGSVAALCIALPALSQTPASPPSAQAEPAMQLPPDQAAFQAANTIADQAQRITALQAFLHDFPKSNRAGRARSIVLHLLTEQQPRDERRIHQVAKASIDAAGKDGRGSQENSVAYVLAEAPPNGVDLKAAEGWARDSVNGDTLAKLSASVKADAAKSKAEVPSDDLIHQWWGHGHAAYLQTLADVYFHENKLADATAALNEAQPLDPGAGSIYVTRGQVAHAQHQDDEALNDLETAVVYGGITPATQELLTTLYAAKHGGDRSGLDAEIDQRYRTVFKAVTPPARKASTSGRTVLLALYTGAGCAPCTAADLALDGVLGNYSRSEVVALAFDQHIPEPDPLANAATVTRATYDDVRYTPTVIVDGVGADGIYGRRDDTAKAYEKLAAALDKQLLVPSGVTLQLSAKLTPAHTVAASAEVHVADADALHKLLTSKPASAKSDASKSDLAKADASAVSAPKAPKLVLNFALVQREVRYSGENGVRFHAMVVRDLARPKAADEFPVELHGNSSASYTFDPAAISTGLSKYLADFSQHSERFGSTHFLTTDTTLPLDDLAVAAWVEDLTSHQVVAAAYTPLAGAHTEQASR